MECEFYDVGCQLSWFVDEIKLIFVFLLDAVFQGALSLIEAIPAPDFLLNASSLSLSLPSQVLFFTTLFKLPQGVSLVVSAYILRFAVRRIPFIG